MGYGRDYGRWMDGYGITAGYDVICIDNFSNSIADEKGEVRGEIK